MNGAEYIIRFLENKNVDTVFGFPGESVLVLYDALGRSSIKHIMTRHEQGAAHAADGYARVTGRPGVIFATSGPGATNLVTGIANAYLDSVPLVAITGQVGLDSIGRDSFQEADIMGITMPITKYSYMVKDIRHLPPIMAEAWNVAISGRPGPVLIDVPRDIFLSTVDLTKVEQGIVTRKGPQKNRLEMQLAKIVATLAEAQKPLIFAGGGIIASQAWDQLVKFVRYTNIPVVTSLMGKGAIPERNPNVVGIVGMHGLPAANLALSECDVLLALGVRFSDRVVGKIQGFRPQVKIIHVDIDPAELSKNVETHIPVVSDANEFLAVLLKTLKENKTNFNAAAWRERIREWKKQFPLKYDKSGSLKPLYIVEEVARYAGDQVIVVTDVGQQQWLGTQYYPIGGRRSFITSGGLGTLGFGLPAAVGASIGRPGEIVVLFTGEGSIQMNIQELATLAQHKLPVKIFIFKSDCLNIQKWQQPDLIRLAEAYGIRSVRIAKPEDVLDTVTRALGTPGPILIECLVDEVGESTK